MKSMQIIRPSRRLPGFTLVEVLVATVCIAIVILALNSTIFTAMRLRTRTTEMVEKSVPLQHTLTLITRDLQGIMASNGPMGGSLTAGSSLGSGSSLSGSFSLSSGSSRSGGSSSGNNSSLAGSSQPGAIQFRTSTGVISDDEEVYWGDVQNVSYYLRQSTATNNSASMELVRAVTRNLLAVNESDLTELPLLDGIKSLEYLFYDGTQWTNGWDSTVASPSLPQAIKLIITMTPEEDQMELPTPFEFTVPVLAESRSNVTATASGGGS